jgi:uncharacterized membrane protein YbaN (DUF454 family)
MVVMEDNVFVVCCWCFWKAMPQYAAMLSRQAVIASLEKILARILHL